MTTKCDGCMSRAAEGAQLELALVGTSPTCTTEVQLGILSPRTALQVLDNAAVVDYTAGSTSSFSDSLLGSCYLVMPDDTDLN